MPPLRTSKRNRGLFVGQDLGKQSLVAEDTEDLCEEMLWHPTLCVCRQ